MSYRRKLCHKSFLSLVLAFLSLQVFAKPVEDFLPKATFENTVTTPESILGFKLGERHPRHDQVLQFYRQLATTSSRVQLKTIGRTTELREQILVTISSEENLKNLPEILEKRQFEQGDLDDSTNSDEPLVVWLGYSVHGDEISGTNASMAVAYYFAANQSEKLSELLANTIIVIEPSINPDGMDRFVNWVNTYRGVTPNDDPNHIEHHQQWRSGRTNHFGFDLNRDWLLVSQQETKNRLPYFYQYQPHVLGDFHEMGHNSTYFFQPGIPSRTNPLTPKANTRLTETLAEFHAQALDGAKQLYYSQESFDDFYYGKGSTYPDINGAIGILFEQASSRGMQQATINGLLTFEQSIQNQVHTSLSTVTGAWQNKQVLLDYRNDFYRQAKKLATKEKFAGYLVSEPNDPYRLNKFLRLLQSHQVEVYPLTSDFRVRDKVYGAENSYFVPLKQNQYHIVKALFTTETDFPDNTFYDVSGWTMPLAMNIDFQPVERTWGLKLAKAQWQQPATLSSNIAENAYAYAFDWHHHQAPNLLQSLLKNDIKVRVATQGFSSEVDGKERSFSAGTIVIPAALQQGSQWRNTLELAANNAEIPVVDINTGFTVKGIDLGSRSFNPVDPVKLLMIGGKGASQYDAAEMLFYLDNQVGLPVTVVEKARLNRIDLNDYTHVLMVDGNYNDLSGSFSEKLEAWLKLGGVVIGQKGAAKWLAENSILKANFVNERQLNQMFDTELLNYQDKEALNARKRIAGAIFESELDLSHPLAFGYQNKHLPVFRKNTLIMERPDVPFVTVAKYTEAPLLSGYSDKNLVNRIANEASLIGHNVGKGRVIATTENLVFRGYFDGSSKLLANSIFFAKAFSARAK